MTKAIERKALELFKIVNKDAPYLPKQDLAQVSGWFRLARKFIRVEKMLKLTDHALNSCMVRERERKAVGK